jgi:hypothetical protein
VISRFTTAIALMTALNASETFAQDPDWLVLFDFRPHNVSRLPTLSVDVTPSWKDWIVSAAPKCDGKSMPDNLPLEKMQKEASTRWLSRRGDELMVMTFFVGESIPVIHVREAARETRLTSDLRTMVQVVAGLPTITGVPKGRCIIRRHPLMKERATVTVSATQEARADSIELTTGPKEHWYLSADVPLTRTTVLDFDPESGAFETEQPSTFYLGVNFLVGDVLSERRRWFEDLGVKALVKASRRPLDSYGVALTWRGSLFRPLGLDFNLIAPYVGWVSERQDEPEENGSARQGHEADWLMGISFNLDVVLGWLGD